MHTWLYVKNFERKFVKALYVFLSARKKFYMKLYAATSDCTTVEYEKYKMLVFENVY